MKKSKYREELAARSNWDSYLLAESGLPGPRGNIELALVVAELGNEQLFRDYLSFDATKAPVNTPKEFLAFCGVLGLGKLIAGGRNDLWEQLRVYANDSRWRTREAVAMALQMVGDRGMSLLIQRLQPWASGSFYEQRAVAAALCEPRLLRESCYAEQTLEILNQITRKIEAVENRKNDAFKALRKGMGYCWSVGIAALPEHGKSLFEAWISVPDKDIRWILKENLKKNRLKKMDSGWVAGLQAQLAK